MNKDKCEICGFQKKRALHLHHIIPRTDKRCTNLKSNLACVCANCHNLIHSGDIILEGWYLTTSGTKLFWHKNGHSHTVRPGIILNKDGSATIIEE